MMEIILLKKVKLSLMPSPLLPRLTWPAEYMDEFLERAELGQTSEVSFVSDRVAELFRFALYNHRKKTGKGQDLMILLDGQKVRLVQKENPLEKAS